MGKEWFARAGSTNNVAAIPTSDRTLVFMAIPSATLLLFFADYMLRTTRKQGGGPRAARA